MTKAIVLDRELARPKYPQCDYCLNRRKGNKCKAFPRGIPTDLLLNRPLHDKPFKGDGGTRFEPADDNIKLR